MLAQSVPAIGIVLVALRKLGGIARHPLAEARLEHEGESVSVVGASATSLACVNASESGPCGSIVLCRLMLPGTNPSGLASYTP